MNHAHDRDRLPGSLRAALSRVISPVGAAPAEPFVQSVLARIAAERDAGDAGPAAWLMPSLGAGLVAATVFLGLGFLSLRQDLGDPGAPDALVDRAGLPDADQSLQIIVEETS